MTLDLKLLETFLAVAGHSSYTKAAVALELTQPAVSLQVRRLEKSLGVTLIEVLGHRVHLTAAGHQLRRDGEKILVAAGRLAQSVALAAGRQERELRIGASTTPGIYLIPQAIRRFRKQCPGIEVSCRIGSTRGIEEAVVANQVDVGIVGGHLSSAELVTSMLRRDRIVFLAPLEHPLVGRSHTGPRDLAGVDVVMREGGSATRQVFLDWMTRAGAKVGPIHEFDGPEAVRAMVVAGLGVTPMSALAVPVDAAAHGLAVLGSPRPALERSLVVIRHPDKVTTPLLDQFLEELRA